MVIFLESTVAVIAFLAFATNAHMIMRTPVPYGKSTLNNSPMAGDGSDFPCKQRPGVYDAEGANNIAAIGDPQTLSFIGGATHSGGSCQVSLTTDLQPTKDTKWMVITSIEGGCPSNVTGNESEDATFTGASTFQYTIPEGVSPGDYTIAWTWFNKVGNREMYMNCGPMTVTAGKKKRYAPAPKVSKRQTSFPDMFVANVGNGCATEETFDYNFPDPGNQVISAGIGPYTTLSCGAVGSGGAAEQPTGSGSAAATASATGSAGAGAGSAPTAASGGFAGGNSGQYSQAPGDSAPTASLVPTSAPAAASSANGGNQVIPVTISAGEGLTPVSPSQSMTAPKYTNASAIKSPASPIGTAPSAADPTGSSSTGSISGAAGQMTGPCTDEGDWNCIDGTSFQRCASGSWSAVIPVDPGMKCTPGKTSDFQMVPAKVKRQA